MLKLDSDQQYQNSKNFVTARFSKNKLGQLMNWLFQGDVKMNNTISFL